MNRISKFGGCLLLLLSAISVVRAQTPIPGSRRDDIAITNVDGAAFLIPHASIRVCQQGATGSPCAPLANVYTDLTITTQSANPFNADENGNWHFYDLPGFYVCQISAAGSLVQTIQDCVVPGIGAGSGISPSPPFCVSNFIGRLDQVCNQIVNKTFDQGGNLLAFVNGPFDLSGDTSFVPPVAPGYTTTQNAQIGFDSLGLNYHGNNGGDKIFGVFSSMVSSGDVTGFLRSSGGTWNLVDAGPVFSGFLDTGGPGPTGGTGIILNADVTAIQDGDTFCYDVSSTLILNCTPGVPVFVITNTTYPYTGVERGEYLSYQGTGTGNWTLPQTSASGSFDANWFTFVKNDSSFDLTITTSTSSFASGGASITLHTGDAYAIFSDPTGSGTYYPRYDNATLIAGTNISFSRTAYGLTINASGGGGGGCTPPGTNTGVLSEHPVGSCTDSADWTWDDGSSKQNMQAGLSNVVGTGSLLFMFGSTNNLCSSAGLATCSDVDAFGNLNKLEDTFGNTGDSFTDNHVVGSGNLEAGNVTRTWVLGEASEVTTDASSHILAVTCLMDGCGTPGVFATGGGTVTFVFSVGQLNQVSAGGASATTGATYLIGQSDVVTSADTSTISSIFNLGEADTSSASGGSFVHDFHSLGNFNSVSGVGASTNENTSAVGYHNQFNSSNGETLNNSVVLGASNTNTASSANTVDTFMFGDALALSNCSHCMLIGENGVDSGVSNFIGIGLSATPELQIIPGQVGLRAATVNLGPSVTPEIVITAGQVKFNAPLIMDPHTIQIVAELFSAIPSCNSGSNGSWSTVSDSTVVAYGATITGGGSNAVSAYCNGVNWTVAGGGTSGAITGSGTANTLTKWTSSSNIGNSVLLDDGTHAVRGNNGFDVNQTAAYLWWATNDTVTGTTANKLACDNGSGKAIICSHTTYTTNNPFGVAVAANGASPGASGSTGICIIGYCSIFFDNTATGGHYAQSSSSVDGDLTDVGATVPANGQFFYYIYSGNSGAGTQAVIRNLTPGELSAASVSGSGKGTQIEINAAVTKSIVNFNATTPAASANNQNINFQSSVAGLTTDVSAEIPQATGSQAGIVELTGDLGGTFSSPLVVKVNGLAVPASANLLSTNSSSQFLVSTADNVALPRKCAAASASGTAYTCSTSPTFVPAAQDEILFKADVANTGSATLNVNSSSAATMKKLGGGTNLAANDLLAGQWVIMIYDGTNWQMQGQVGNAPAGGTVTSIATTAPITGGTITTTGTIGCATCVVNNSTNTGTSAMTLDLSAATGSNAEKVPVGAGLTTTASGAIGVDSTNNNLHIGLAAADSVVPTTTVTPVNGNCSTWSVSGGRFKLGDTGSPCGGTPGGGIVGYSATSVSIPSNTYYFPIVGGGSPSTTETTVDTESPSAATITNFYASVSVALGAGNSAVFTYRDNTVSQSLTCTISGASQTSCNDSTHSFNAVKGDLLTIQVVTAGTIVVSPTLIMTAQFGTTGSNGTVNTGTINQTGYYAAAGTAISGVGPGTSGQIYQSQGSGSPPAFNDLPDVKIIPAANCPNAVAGSGWSYATSNFTAACRAGSNNLGGALQAIPSTGAAAQFLIELPQDWDTSSQPYINVYYGSGTNTSGTVIWTASSACVDVSTPGGASDDPSFHAESAFSTQTMANASRMWYVGGQFTAVTSGNGCKALSPIIIKLAVSGTAGANINAYQAVVTIPRLPKVQAN